MTRVATAAKEIDEVHDDKPVLVDPRQVTIDAEFQKTRKIIVIAPGGAVADDLRDPSIWKSVQTNRFASLRADDVLSIRAADGSWRVDAEVVVARGDSAVLAIGKVRSWPVEASSYSDGKRRVVFEGGAWWVVSIDTGARIGNGHAMESMAINYARSLNPQVVA